MISKIFESEVGERVCQKRTICEVHRELFDLLIMEFHDNPAQLRKAVKLLEDAFVMGKKITTRLVECKIRESYELNDNYKKSEQGRKERKNLIVVLKHNKEFLSKYA